MVALSDSQISWFWLHYTLVTMVTVSMWSSTWMLKGLCSHGNQYSEKGVHIAQLRDKLDRTCYRVYFTVTQDMKKSCISGYRYIIMIRTSSFCFIDRPIIQGNKTGKCTMMLLMYQVSYKNECTIYCISWNLIGNLIAAGFEIRQITFLPWIQLKTTNHGKNLKIHG